MKPRLASAVMLAFMLAPVSAMAKHKTSSDDPQKTEHVRAYTKKNGEHVNAYNRRPKGEGTRSKHSKVQ